MKKLLLIIALIVVALMALYFATSSSTQVVQNQSGGSKPDPTNATYVVEGEKVTFKNGLNNTEEQDGLTMESRVLETIAYGDLNADGEEDALALIAQSGGGSGTFVYVVVYVSGPVKYNGSNAIFLGDRISPQSLSVKNGVATVKYLDRKEDEPFSAEPTVSTTKQLVYKSGELAEK